MLTLGGTSFCIYEGLLIKYAIFSKKYRLTGNQGIMKLAHYASLLCKFYLLQDCNFLRYSRQFYANKVIR